MAVQFAGTATVIADGKPTSLRGNLTVSPSAVERTMIAGQDGIHGFQELPRVPYIEGDFSTVPGFSLQALLNQTDITVIAQCANKYEYVLYNAVIKGGFEANTRDGQVRIRWEGIDCQEVQM